MGYMRIILSAPTALTALVDETLNLLLRGT